VHKTPWRSFKTAAWLGWQIESNWTRPLLFALYSVVKPLALCAILVVLYATIAGANFSSPLFAYMYIGNAFYIYVGAVMTGMAFAVADDRERYQTLRSIYVAPVNIPAYLAGRGVARFLTASISVFITLLLGILFLRLPIRLGTIHWPLFLVALATGVVMLAMMGLMLSGFALLLPDNSWTLGDGVAGSLYLFSGAIFPIDVLPKVLRPLGFALPVTYWLELLRRSLVGASPEVQTFAAFSDLHLAGILVGLTFLLSVAALGIFYTCDKAARERGYIDRTTAH
jgi:ABC-2 type transport system permease protein